jgi:hypothetical protein
MAHGASGGGKHCVFRSYNNEANAATVLSTNGKRSHYQRTAKTTDITLCDHIENLELLRIDFL